MMYDEIVTEMDKVTASMPQISFGDLLTKVFHDYDNLVGVAVGGGGRIFGDDTLLHHPELLGRGDNVTVELATQAVLAGNGDVQIAHDLGTDPAAPGDDDSLFAAVRTRTGMTGGQFRPESLVPTPSADNAPHQFDHAQHRDPVGHGRRAAAPSRSAT